MKKLATFAVVALACFSLATAAVAQDPGDIGVFFDLAGTQTSATPTPSVPFPAYVIAFGAGPISGWEGSVAVSNAATLFILDNILNPPTSLNVSGGTDYIVGLGACVEDAANALVTYNLLALAPAENLLCMGAASSSSFNPPAPGYASCDNQLASAGFAANGQGFYPDGCAVLFPVNPEPVSTETTSWGAVKADF